MCFRLPILALCALLVLAGSVAAQAPLTAVRVPGAGPITDPTGAFWKRAKPVKVAMLPQTVTFPHHPEPAVK